MSDGDTTYPPRDLASHPPALHEAYGSTKARAPSLAPVVVPHTLSELTGPRLGLDRHEAIDADLTRNAVRNGAPLGERIVVTGRVMDEGERPVPDALVEVWQCNAAGRYHHPGDQHDAPIDPNFSGAGSCVSDADGRYRFTTLKPAAYPWGNHPNAWRPAHIHFSLFGPATLTRLITQMYFPGDPLLPLDPIFMSTPAGARDRLVAAYDHDVTMPGHALGYRFDIVLRGRRATPGEG